LSTPVMRPLVLHVLPLDLARGAQRYARAMKDALDGGSQRHLTLTLFRSDVRVLDADLKLDFSMRISARAGLDPRVVLALREVLHRHEPCVVVAHGSQPLKYLAPVCPRARLVYYKIGTSTARATQGLHRRLHSLLLARAGRVAGVSQDCLDEARDVFGVPAARLRLIPNGRDPSVFTPSTVLRPDPPMLTFVGHFAATKRPAKFIELVRRLRADGVELRARMIGDGPLLAALTGAAHAAGVELLGRRDDVPSQLRDSDVLAFTSLPDNEGMPGVFIEAGMSGLPVVTTDVPGARSVIEDGTTGFIVPVSDDDAMMARTRRLLTDAALRRQMGAMARERCSQELSLMRSAELWARLVDEMVSEAARG